MNPELLNGSTLAFIGDAVLSLWVREYLVSLGYTKANDLQKKSIIYVSANAQAKFMLSLLEDYDLLPLES
jgi:ribonuclease-3 family protein